MTRRGAGATRAGMFARSAAVVLSWTFACLIIGVLAARFPLTIDATATREHRLSDRTNRLLATLNDEHEIVIVYNSAASDPTLAARSLDVLRSFERSSGQVRASTIDVASARGLAQLDATIARLVEAYKPQLDHVSAGVSETIDDASRLAADLRALSPPLLALKPTVPPADASAPTLTKFLEDSAAVLRLSASDLERSAENARAMLSQRIGQTRVPAVDEAASGLRATLGETAAQLRGVLEGLDALSGAKAGAVPEELQRGAGAMLGNIRSSRDRVNLAIARLDDLPRPPVTGVARLLERSSAAIVIGPARAQEKTAGAQASPGLAALDMELMFPARAESAQPGTRPDTRARTEDVLSAAFASLEATHRPIVVLVHATGSRLGPEFRLFPGLRDRLRLRGVDLVEWAVALDATQPSLTTINPGSLRPVVYVALPATADSQETAQRMLKLAASLRDLIERGENVLVSLNPSSLPTIGQPDPLAEFLVPLGVRADTSRPLLNQQQTQAGRLVGAELSIVEPLGAGAGEGPTVHPISRAIRGLRTDLLWCIPINVEPVSGVTASALAIVTSQNGRVWAESQWSEFRRVAPAQRASITNPPSPDAARDDDAGPWTIGLAIERARPDGGSAQRIVVVGSNGWFFDEIAAASAMIDARPTLISPGNAELFDASLAWLARMDDLIASGAQATPGALIPPMSDGALRLLRWGLIAGLPLLVLLAGAVWRLLRG